MVLALSSDKPPISTYEQAILWLVSEWVGRPEMLAEWVPMPPEGRLVAQLFWVTEKTVRADVHKHWRDLFNQAPKALPRRGGI